MPGQHHLPPVLQLFWTRHCLRLHTYTDIVSHSELDVSSLQLDMNPPASLDDCFNEARTLEKT